MYKTKFSTKTQARHLIHRELRKAQNIKNLRPRDLTQTSGPPLLQRQDPLKAIQLFERLKTTTMTRIENITANKRAKLQFHEHHRTCHKGCNGFHGCRFAKKSGISNGTRPVFLIPVDVEKQNGLDSMCHECNNDFLPMSVEPKSSNKKSSEAQKYPYKIQQNDLSESMQYKLRNPIDKKDSKIIVWELDRPYPDLKEEIENGSLSSDLDQLMLSSSFNDDEVMLRKFIKTIFCLLLKYEQDTVGDPYKENKKLWNWIETEDLKTLEAFYSKFIDSLKTSNQYVVEHSPVLFYVTGSHNNTLLLGAIEAARSAMFYVAPYVAKGKATLSACLTILEKARKDVEKYPSKAADMSTNPRRRLAQYFVTRVVNKMNAYMEQSEYQISAYLIRLPSRITSEVYDYSEPKGAIAFRESTFTSNNTSSDSDDTSRAYLETTNNSNELSENYSNVHEESDSDDEEHEENEDDDVEKSLFGSRFQRNKHFGHVSLYTVEEGTDTTKAVKRAIPRVSLYFNRGKKLENLSMYEYDALIQVRRKPENEKTRSECFDFSSSFYLASMYTQTLKAKQSTMIFKGKPPKHPGEKPKSKYSIKKWKKKADVYANYVLTMFRPESIYEGKNTENYQEYDWEALQKWITMMQQDSSILSAFQLMSIERRMNALNSDFATKCRVNDYCFRDQDKWTEEKKQVYKEEDRLEQLAKINDYDVMNEDEFNEIHSSLSNRVASSIKQTLVDDAMYLGAIKEHSYSTNKSNNDSECSSLQQNVVFDQLSMDDLLSKSEAVYDESNFGEQIEDTNNTIDDLRPSGRSMKYKLNKDQKEIVDLYAKYLENPEKEAKNVPPIVLMTGKGGTGKSFVINTLIEYGKEHGNIPWTSASNNLNATNIGGHTIAKLLQDNYNVKCNQKSKKGNKKIPLKQRALNNLIHQEPEKIPMLIIDEVSNIVVEKIARLSNLFGVACGNANEPFGGIKVLLVGDYNQKKPVDGDLATTSLMKLEKRKLEEEEHEKFDNTLRRTKHNSLLSNNEHNPSSDYSIGCKLLASAKWFELTIAERSKDNNHNNLIDRMYYGKSISSEDIKQYELWNTSNLKKDSKEEMKAWLNAPIIIKTNREKHTMNFERAKEFAKATNTVVIRWSSRYDKWEGKPLDDDNIASSLKDPIFFELFVKNGNCYLTDTICKNKKLCNGTRGKFHSLILSAECRDNLNFRLSHSKPGDVIDLFESPIGINILLEDPNLIENKNINWQSLLLNSEQIVITVQQCQKNLLK